MSEYKQTCIVYLISILFFHYLSRMKSPGRSKRQPNQKRVNSGNRPCLKKHNLWIGMRHGTWLGFLMEGILLVENRCLRRN